METFSALLAICTAGIHRLPVNSSHKGQWRGALMFFFDMHLNKGWSKQWWGWWFEMPSRHFDVIVMQAIHLSLDASSFHPFMPELQINFNNLKIVLGYQDNSLDNSHNSTYLVTTEELCNRSVNIMGINTKILTDFYTACLHVFLATIYFNRLSAELSGRIVICWHFYNFTEADMAHTFRISTSRYTWTCLS